MTLYIEKAEPAAQYNWIVYNGNRKYSQHNKKSAAKRSALKKARSSGAVVKEQMADGTWRTIRNY